MSSLIQQVLDGQDRKWKMIARSGEILEKKIQFWKENINLQFGYFVTN